MTDIEILESREKAILEVWRTLTTFSPYIASLCESKTADEIEKIINNEVAGALKDLLISRHKQCLWIAEKDIFVNIIYVDAKKKRTTRKIKIEQIKSSEGNSSFLIEAYCYLRNTRRSFKTENIQTMYYENGEITTINDLIQQMKDCSKMQKPSVSLLKEFTTTT